MAQFLLKLLLKQTILDFRWLLVATTLLTAKPRSRYVQELRLDSDLLLPTPQPSLGQAQQKNKRLFFANLKHSSWRFVIKTCVFFWNLNQPSLPLYRFGASFGAWVWQQSEMRSNGNGVVCAYVTFHRRGEPWGGFDLAPSIQTWTIDCTTSEVRNVLALSVVKT